jgi:hypothetical protein
MFCNRSHRWEKKKATKNCKSGGTTEAQQTSKTTYDRRRDSSVGIVTEYALLGWGSIPGRGKNFFCSIESRPDLDSTQTPIQ